MEFYGENEDLNAEISYRYKLKKAFFLTGPSLSDLLIP